MLHSLNLPPTREGVACALLHQLSDWRVRAVERIDLTSGLWAEHERVIHVKPLRETGAWEILKNHLDIDDSPSLKESYRLILPIADLPNEPLIDVDIQVNGATTHRIPRRENGRIQAEYFRYLAESVTGERLPDCLMEFISEVFSFTPGAWKSYFTPGLLGSNISLSCRWPLATRRKTALRNYLQANGVREVKTPDLETWDRLNSDVSGYTRKQIYRAYWSAAEHPILAIPGYCRQQMEHHGRLIDGEEITWLLRRLGQLMGRLDRIQRYSSSPESGQEASSLLYLYASYGRRYFSMADSAVPLDRPFTITIKGRRAMQLDTQREGWEHAQRITDKLTAKARQHICYADAATNHLNIRIPDVHVQFTKRAHEVFDEKFQKIKTVALISDDESKSQEHYFLYGCKRDRPLRIWVRCRLHQSNLPRVAAWGALGSIFAATSILIHFGHLCRFSWCAYNGKKELSGSDLAAILFPVTIAASVLLSRETTTLGFRVKRLLHIFLMVALGALWALTVTLYFIKRVKLS